jgi:hypothetical protein
MCQKIKETGRVTQRLLTLAIARKFIRRYQVVEPKRNLNHTGRKK